MIVYYISLDHVTLFYRLFLNWEGHIDQSWNQSKHTWSPQKSTVTILAHLFVVVFYVTAHPRSIGSSACSQMFVCTHFFKIRTYFFSLFNRVTVYSVCLIRHVCGQEGLLSNCSCTFPNVMFGYVADSTWLEFMFIECLQSCNYLSPKWAKHWLLCVKYEDASAWWLVISCSLLKQHNASASVLC